MNTENPQLVERRRELAIRLSSILVPELCLFAQVLNSLDRTKLGAFQVLTAQTCLVLKNVKIYLLGLPFSEGNHVGPGTEHVFDEVFDEMAKHSPKEI